MYLLTNVLHVYISNWNAFILHLDFDNFYKNGSKENHQLIRITYKNFSKNQ